MWLVGLLGVFFFLRGMNFMKVKWSVIYGVVVDKTLGSLYGFGWGENLIGVVCWSGIYH